MGTVGRRQRQGESKELSRMNGRNYGKEGGEFKLFQGCTGSGFETLNTRVTICTGDWHFLCKNTL